VGIRETIGAAIGRGLAPLARTLAAEQLASPWADTSNLATITVDQLFGYAEGIRPTRMRAMQVATIAAGRNTITGTISRLGLYTEKDAARTVFQSPLLAQPERGVPRSTTLTWTLDTLIFHPCAWWHVTERDAAGWPVWVERVAPGDERTDDDGNLIGIRDRVVDPKDGIRFDSPTGSGLLIDAARTIRRAIVIEESAALAEDNPVPVIELHNDGDKLSPEEINDLMDIWQAARRRRGVAFTSKGITAIPHGTQVSQLLIEGRKAINLDLIRHLNIPAWAAEAAPDGGGSVTYQNRQSRNWDLIDITCAPFMEAIVSRLSMADLTPRGWAVKFDTDELTKPDQQTRFTTYEVGKRAGFVTNEMIAAWEGWQTVPEEISK